MKSELFDAVVSGDLEKVNAIIARDPAAAGARGDDGLSAVTQAAYRGRRDIVDVLLAARPELDVFEAATVGDAGRVRDLIEADAALVSSYSPDGFTPLHLAAHFDHPDVVRVLLERGADVRAVTTNFLANQPLHAAAAGNATAAAEVLIAAGADVDARQRQGVTPVHLAAQNGNSALVTSLLRAGAEPTLRTDDGRDAIAFARESNDAEVSRVLASSRATT